MKTFKTFLAIIVGIAVAGVATTVSAQSSKQGYATAVRVQGNVTYSLGQGQPEYPLVAGKYLPPGAIIFTKENGEVDLILGKSLDLPQAKWSPDRISEAADAPVRGYVTYKPTADQNAVRLTPNSTMAIDKLTIVDTGTDAVSDTELDLKKGKIFAAVRKLSGASQYIVKIPNGVAGVRGTLFSIDIDGGVACYESTGGGVILSVMIGGHTSIFVIQPQGSSNPIQITPQFQAVLKQIFDALRTTYFQVVDYEFDHTGCFISPTHGKGGGGSEHGPI
jgi:hypothetical protein